MEDRNMLVSERTQTLDLVRYSKPPRRRRRLFVSAAALLLAALAGIVAVSLWHRGTSPADGQAKAAAGAFLTSYVDSDGRVVRHDQGNDTVSEGQAYALLLAEAAGDESRFASIWDWTRTHLQEPDGLFAFRTDAAGNVADPQPASDADVLIAWALVEAKGPNAAVYHLEGRRVATAVLAHETVRRGSTLMLAAGPWATGEPVTLDPSYWAPAAFEALSSATGDIRWSELDDATFVLSNELTSGGTLLPPDWAKVDSTTPVAEPAPNRSALDVQYGLDAQRLVVWLATSCDARGPALAARLNSLLTDRENSLALTQRGQVISVQTNATPIVAAAAAAQAAGDTARRDSLLAQAAAENAANPTYYGSAWVALGRTLLTTNLLGGCHITAG
jgi:endo-1,4-beta-D-glucanase Y